jgi:hypothetical protein
MPAEALNRSTIPEETASRLRRAGEKAFTVTRPPSRYVVGACPRGVRRAKVAGSRATATDKTQHLVFA